MGHLVGIAQLLNSGRAVAAAHDGDGVGLAQGLSHGLGAFGKGGELEHAHGTVPDDGARIGHGAGVELHGLGADVQAHPAVGDLTGGDDLALGVGGEGVGHDGVHRQQQLDALVGGLLHHLVGVILPIGLQQRGADLAALSGGEGVGHAAADDDGVGDLQQVVDDADLAADLAAAQNGDQRTLGVGQRAADDLQLFLNEETGHGGQVVGHTGGGGVGAVNGAEGVGDVDAVCAGQIGQCLGKGGIVLLLALLKAQVLQQHDLTGLKGGGLGLGVLAHHIAGENDALAQQLLQTFGHRGQAQLRLDFALGLAQMGAGDDGCALIQQILEGGQSGADALVIGDGAGLLILGHVEVAAAEHLLALHVDVGDGLLVVIHAEKAPFECRAGQNFLPVPISPSPSRPGKPFCRSAS